MKVLLATLALVCLSFTQAEAREPLFPKVKAFLTGRNCGCTTTPVRNVVNYVSEAAPVRTVASNTLTNVGNAFVQTGSLVLPTRSTCSNGNCR